MYAASRTINPCLGNDLILPIIVYEDLHAKDRKLTPSTFRGKKKSELPDSIISDVTIPEQSSLYPGRAYQAPFEKIYLQNERVIVCYQDCQSSPKLDLSLKHKNNETVLRQTSTYYWVNRVLEYVETLGFGPTTRLTIYIDRDIPDPTSRVSINNNAFFNDANWTLNFLPDRASYFARSAFKVNPAPSSHDPSVMMHEASHSVFESLMGPFLNSEIYGLHEAIADYLSMSVLNNPDIGIIMGRGHLLRSARNVKSFALIKDDAGIEHMPEAHDLGNIVASALWNIRGLLTSKGTDAAQADKIVLEAVKNLGKIPYATVGDLEKFHLDALNHAGLLTDEVQEIWKKTNLPKIEKTPLANRENSENVLVAGIHHEQVPTDIAKAFGEATLDVPFRILLNRTNPNRPNQNLVLLDAGPGTPKVELIYDRKLKSYVGGAVDSETNKTLRALKPAWGDLAKLLQGTFGSDVLQITAARNDIVAAVSSGDFPGTDIMIDQKQESTMWEDFRMEKGLMGWIINQTGHNLDLDELTSAIRSIKRIKVNSCKSCIFTKTILKNNFNYGAVVTGYGIEYGSGVQESTQIQSLSTIP